MEDFTAGLLTGIFIGIMLVSVYTLVKIQIALNNDENSKRCDRN